MLREARQDMAIMRLRSQRLEEQLARRGATDAEQETRWAAMLATRVRHVYSRLLDASSENARLATDARAQRARAEALSAEVAHADATAATDPAAGPGGVGAGGGGAGTKPSGPGNPSASGFGYGHDPLGEQGTIRLQLENFLSQQESRFKHWFDSELVDMLAPSASEAVEAASRGARLSASDMRPDDSRFMLSQAVCTGKALQVSLEAKLMVAAEQLQTANARASTLQRALTEAKDAYEKEAEAAKKAARLAEAVKGGVEDAGGVVEGLTEDRLGLREFEYQEEVTKLQQQLSQGATSRESAS